MRAAASFSRACRIGLSVAVLCASSAVCAFAAVSSGRPVESHARLDVLRLSEAVDKVAALPSGDFDCYVEGEEDEPRTFRSRKERLAFERAKRAAAQYLRKCETARKRQSAAYNRARNALNKTWLPVLEDAVARGDPVAEVVLRSCETAPMLDRTGVASDCSENDDDRKFAQARLEAIDFKPALHKYPNTSERGWFDHCSGDYPARERCQAAATIARYKRILDVIRTGYLGVAESWNSCTLKSEHEELDRLAEECQRLFYLMRAAVNRAPRSYVPGLSLARRDEPLPGDAFDLNNLSRLDRSPFRDPDFQSKFNVEAENLVREIAASIESDLRRDPRWGIFLWNRLK